LTPVFYDFVFRARFLLLLLLFSAACQGEPKKLCDAAKVIWEFNDVSVSPKDDVSPEPGLQIDVSARTSIRPGTVLQLLIAKGDEAPMPGPEAVVGPDGRVIYPAVTLPNGEVTLTLQGNNGCQMVQFSHQLFVFDDRGDATCVLSVREPVVSADSPPEQFLNAAADSDPIAPGFQAHFLVDTGRPAIDVQLLALDIATRVETNLRQLSDTTGHAVFAVTLQEGKQAIQAICRWQEVPSPRPSATLSFTVDTIAPDCRITRPTAAVQSGPFVIGGATTATDAFGTVPVFVVEGAQFNGTPVDSTGQSTAVATMPSPAPLAQRMSITLHDRAGNPCQSAVVLN
jgi:hypothetical protein